MPTEGGRDWRKDGLGFMWTRCSANWVLHIAVVVRFLC